MTPIYLDNAATTPVAPEVAEVVAACMCEDYGNPSSAHHMGISAERRIKNARAQLASAIGDADGRLGALYWTSGGTESDALGVAGAARARGRQGKHILYSAIEHPAVRESARMLTREGFVAEPVPVDASGVVDLDALSSALRADTVVVAVMLVNNEIGTVQPVADIAALLREKHSGADGVHLHCDAVQALGKLPLSVEALGADSVAFAAHKLHGPKGVGALWVKKGARLHSLWAGGGQQSGIRSGTLNVPGIAGLGAAAALADDGLDSRQARWREYAEVLTRAARDSGVEVHENGAGAVRAPHVLSLGFAGVPAEPLLHVLESRGVLVSAGSACAERDRKPSPVLTAIGVHKNTGTLRFSFGRQTTREQVEAAAGILIDAVRDL